MEFPKLNKDLAIISKLGDNPNIDDDLSSAGLKAKFDESALILQKFLNEELIAELDRLFAGGDSVPVDGLNMNGAINMNNNPLQNVRDPSSEHEALNLRYALKNFLSTARNINGKSLENDIVLTAEDVGARSNTWLPTPAEIGARPNSWTPTAEQVGARPNTWLPTIAEIGAAPAGFGLGGTCRTTQNWDDATECGFWTAYEGLPPSINGVYYHGIVYEFSDFVYQDIKRTGDNFDSTTLTRKRNSDGVWSEWEWVNPPMTPGVEYRTTERINGNTVYKKAESDGEILYRLDGESTWRRARTIKKLLWQNASPASEFAKQDVSVDLSGCQRLIVDFTANVENWNIQMSHECNATGETLLFVPSTAGLHYRSMEIHANKISFYNGNAAANVNDNSCVPLIIYGIKEAT
jgi:hypothetical protein